MHHAVLSLLFALLSLLIAAPAMAGNWGESWGSMVWGSVAAVPTMGWLGGGLLVSLLVGLSWWRRPGSGGTVLGLLLALGLAQGAEAQISVPHTFVNGTVADADAMSANFTAVENGVNAALATGSVTVPYTFTNGTTANAAEVNANFTAVVDGVNTALANRAADCVAAGGTWNAGASTCTAASNYNCFVGGFCSQVAIEFPPATNGYTNLYDGHTQGTEPALGAGCNSSPGSGSWASGVLDAQVGGLNLITVQMCE